MNLFIIVVLSIIYVISAIFSAVNMEIFKWKWYTYILAIVPVINSFIGLPLIIYSFVNFLDNLHYKQNEEGDNDGLL